jgi:hypothetical protein
VGGQPPLPVMSVGGQPPLPVMSVGGQPPMTTVFTPQAAALSRGPPPPSYGGLPPSSPAPPPSGLPRTGLRPAYPQHPATAPGRHSPSVQGRVQQVLCLTLCVGCLLTSSGCFSILCLLFYSVILVLHLILIAALLGLELVRKAFH